MKKKFITKKGRIISLIFILILFSKFNIFSFLNDFCSKKEEAIKRHEEIIGLREPIKAIHSLPHPDGGFYFITYSKDGSCITVVDDYSAKVVSVMKEETKSFGVSYPNTGLVFSYKWFHPEGKLKMKRPWSWIHPQVLPARSSRASMKLTSQYSSLSPRRSVFTT